tara:strand:- start:23 stop:574 length:552 start_codon:yes stop_codon:yes gene_type:complete
MSVKVISNNNNPYTKEVFSLLDNIKKFPTRKPKLEAKGRAKWGGGNRNNIGQKGEYHAFVLGKARDYTKSELVESTYNKRYPELHSMLIKWVKWKFPKHKWNAIQINKNVSTGYHFDKNNQGESLCIGVGDYKGGGVRCKLCKGEKDIDNKNKWLVYDGTKIEHKTIKPISGTRYAIIFYLKR